MDKTNTRRYMKFTDNTIVLLKNFSAINTNLQFTTGNVLKTISPQKNILARTKVEEHFPQDFAIYDLNKFLGAISLFDKPEIEVDETKLIIQSNGNRLNYVLADPSMIVAPPEKEIELPSEDINFKLSKTNLDSVIRAAQVLSLPELVFSGDKEKIRLVATDMNNDSCDEYDVVVGETDKTFKMVFKIENMKMMSGDYDVTVSSKGISHFKNANSNLEYWIATEASSNYEG